jgi:predicted DNA-binding antitoxin AbrB/MazE fold protein
MSTIRATVRNGRIEPDEPFVLPEGTEVEITIPENDDEPMSQTEIDRVLTAMDQMVPLQMSDAELAAWEADRQARKEWEKAHFFEHAEKLRRMWE